VLDVLRSIGRMVELERLSGLICPVSLIFLGRIRNSPPPGVLFPMDVLLNRGGFFPYGPSIPHVTTWNSHEEFLPVPDEVIRWSL